MATELDSPQRRFKLLRRATHIKWKRFTWSGLILIIVGIVVINVGLVLAAYSAEGLLVGLGAIIALVGVLRVLIGLINPATPAELDSSLVDSEEAKSVEEVVLEE